jgi:hypothetical protein
MGRYSCDVRKTLPIAAILACSLLLASCGGTAQSSPDPKTTGNPQPYGKWTTLPQQMPINPIHAALLHTGKVLVITGSANCPPTVAGCPQGPSYTQGAALFDLQSGNITTLPTAWDMFCNGMSIMQDGRVLINGGTKSYGQLGVVGQTQDVPFTGLPNTSIFDPSTETFVSATATAHGRWYPTMTELGDGRMMTTSGLNDSDGGNNNTSEIWDGQAWSAEIPGQPNISDFPGFVFPLYPRMHLLPTGHILYTGPSSAAVDFDPSNQTWTLVAWTTYPGPNDPNGERTYGTSVLLPLTPQNNYNAKVIIMGGDNPATKTTETIDFSDAGQALCLNTIGYAPCWQNGPDMAQARVEMQATILPNGKVLVDAGSVQDEDATTASLKAEIYDPATNTFSSAGSNAFPRLYHNTQLLLPDGTVALAGGNPDQGPAPPSFEPHIEIYTPAYLFNADGSAATRPTITSAPSGVTYAAPFTVQTPNTDIASVVLMRAGSDTHSFDMDQRYVGLSFTAASGNLTVTGPPNSNVAPPGYYMLFVVNSAGTPSLASWTQVQGPVAGVARVTLHPERVPTPKYIVQRRHVTEAPLQLRKEMHVH